MGKGGGNINISSTKYKTLCLWYTNLCEQGRLDIATSSRRLERDEIQYRLVYLKQKATDRVLLEEVGSATSCTNSARQDIAQPVRHCQSCCFLASDDADG
ncbi:hypothetical protein CS542_10350 [Pedobacter sp. IW39]|nr:hypothetical protein CS542_10350 [Pedobacter sp. IW39]